MPFLNSPENKKGANLLVRHDQQIDASKIYLFGCKKTAPFLKTAASKRAPRWFNVANHRQSGVQIPSVARKGRLASMEKSLKLWAEKARKWLMPLALRQWHLYRLDFMEHRNTIDARECPRFKDKTRIIDYVLPVSAQYANQPFLVFPSHIAERSRHEHLIQAFLFVVGRSTHIYGRVE